MNGTCQDCQTYGHLNQFTTADKKRIYVCDECLKNVKSAPKTLKKTR